jgi:hypothetical protein
VDNPESLQSGERFHAGDAAAAVELWARGLGEWTTRASLRQKSGRAGFASGDLVWHFPRGAPDRTRPLFDKAIVDFEK